MEYPNDLNKEKYIIEIKSGLYVSRIVLGNTYSFTKDVVKAHKFVDLDSAKGISKYCDGTVKECRVKHELSEVVE